MQCFGGKKLLEKPERIDAERAKVCSIVHHGIDVFQNDNTYEEKKTGRERRFAPCKATISMIRS